MAIYREIPAATVPATTRRAAEAALRKGCAVLGFALPPELRWCTLVTDPAEADHAVKAAPPGRWCAPGYLAALGPICGMNDSAHWTLWLATELSQRDTSLTVLHELGHLRRRRAGQPVGDVGTPRRQAEEAEVEAWAHRLLNGTEEGGEDR